MEMDFLSDMIIGIGLKHEKQTIGRLSSGI